MVEAKTKRRPAFERSARAGRGFNLTDGDLKAVEDVGRFRLIKASQLLQLNWPRPSQRRHGESRLRELFHAGWLDRQPFGYGLGHPFAVYSLGHLGRLHVAAKLGVPTAEVGPRPAKERRHDALFLQHHLQTVQTVINLSLAAGRQGGSLVYYREERLLRSDATRSKSGLSVIPDAFVVLNIGSSVQSFCIELDRTTVDRAPWQRRIKDYLAWVRSDRYRSELREPVVLIVVDAAARSAQRRIVDLKSEIDKEAARQKADASFLWLTTLDEASPEAALAKPIWLVGGQEGLHSILAAGNG